MRFRNSGRKWRVSSWRTSASAAACDLWASLHSSRSQIAGQDDDRVAEVHRPALAVGQASIVEQLQQDVEDLRVGLLDLVEQDDAVGPASDGFRQLAALFVADVPRRARRSGERPCVSPGTRPCRCGPWRVRRRTGTPPPHAPARSCRRRSGPGRGTSRSADPGPAGPSGSGARRWTRRAAACVLPDHALVQAFLHVDQLLHLAFEQPGDRDARPARDHAGDVFGVDFFLEQGAGRPGLPADASPGRRARASRSRSVL